MPPADHSNPPEPKPEEIRQLREILRNSTSALASMTKRTRAAGTLSSADGKRIASLKRLVTWLHIAMAAHRTTMRRLRLGDDTPTIYHVKDMVIDGQPRVLVNLTEKYQRSLLMSAIVALRETKGLPNSSLAQYLFETEAVIVNSGMWVLGIEQSGLATKTEQVLELLHGIDALGRTRAMAYEQVNCMQFPNPLVGPMRRVLPSADTHG